MWGRRSSRAPIKCANTVGGKKLPCTSRTGAGCNQGVAQARAGALLRTQPRQLGKKLKLNACKKHPAEEEKGVRVGSKGVI